MSTVLMEREIQRWIGEHYSNCRSSDQNHWYRWRIAGRQEQLEDYLILNLNKALNRAADIYDKVAAVASEGMPNIPGLDMFK
jgi:hypothetical protein